MNCQTCIHWRKLERFVDEKGHAPNAALPPCEDNRAGECRCKPPVAIPSVGGGFRVFPVTRAMDGCGDWKEPCPVVAGLKAEQDYTLAAKKRGRPKKLVDDNVNVQ